MSLIKRIKSFFNGAFDYDNPSAGCGCCGIEADPEIKRAYFQSKAKSK